MRDALVVEREGHGVEHVSPQSLLPAPVLREAEPQVREAVGHGLGGFELRSPAAARHAQAYSLGRVGGEAQPSAPGDRPGGAGDGIEPIEPGHRVAVGLLHDDRARRVCRCEDANAPSDGLQPSRSLEHAERDGAVREQPAASEDSEAEFTGTGIDGEDGGVTSRHADGV